MSRCGGILIWVVIAAALAGPGTAGAQVRALLAQHAPTGEWFQRLDTGPKPAWQFRAEVAQQFAVPLAEVVVVETTLADETARDAVVRALASGAYVGRSVRGAAPGPAPEDVDGLRRQLGSVFPGSSAQKRARWAAVLEQYPAAGVVLTLLRGPMAADAKELATEIVTRLCRRVGTATEVLTAAEYDALAALAAGKNLGGLVPARPCP